MIQCVISLGIIDDSDLMPTTDYSPNMDTLIALYRPSTK